MKQVGVSLHYSPIKIFHLLTCMPVPWVSPKKSSERTYGYWLAKLKLVCPWKLKIFFCWKFMKYVLKYMIIKYQSFYQNLLRKVKVNWKNSRCFRSHFVSLLESFQSIPSTSQQNTSQNSGGSWVLLKALYLVD